MITTGPPAGERRPGRRCGAAHLAERWAGAAAVVMALTGLAGSAFGSVHWEAELNYELHNAGGASIVLASCQHASGGFSLQGLDCDGDCVDFFFTTPTAWCFTDSIRAAAPVDGTWSFRFQVLPYGGGGPLIDYVHRPVQGRGMG